MNCSSCMLLYFISLIVHCNYPNVGPNVSIEGYSSGVEGSQIVYYCQPGLLPSDRLVANCRDDGSWSPNPDNLVCTADVSYRDCPIPELLANNIVEIRPLSNETHNTLVISLHCAEAFTPNHTFTTVCTNEGKWNPDPTEHKCHSKF